MTIPVHGNRDLRKGTAAAVLRDTNLTVEKPRELLHGP